jgi:hypothetical protein
MIKFRVGKNKNKDGIEYFQARADHSDREETVSIGFDEIDDHIKKPVKIKIREFYENNNEMPSTAQFLKMVEPIRCEYKISQLKPRSWLDAGIDIGLATLEQKRIIANSRKKLADYDCQLIDIEIEEYKRPYEEEYRKKCAFTFDKNVTIVEGYDRIADVGWYHPKTNPNGLTRDHILSVKYGFINGVDPKDISHPANCQLLPHSENCSKGARCDFTHDDLRKRIGEWDKDREFPRNHNLIPEQSWLVFDY